MKEEDELMNIDSDEIGYSPVGTISSSDIVHHFQIQDDFFNRENGAIKNSLITLAWNLTKLPCNWVLGRTKNWLDEKLCFGSCKDCGGKIHFYTVNKTTMQIIVQNVGGDVDHTSKHRTTAQDPEVIEMLKTATATVVRNALANKIMTIGDVEPAHLKSQNALAIQRHRAKYRGVHDIEPITAIRFVAIISFHFISSLFCHLLNSSK